MQHPTIIIRLISWVSRFKSMPNIYFGRHISGVPDHSIILFPYRPCRFGCGIAGIVSYKKKKQPKASVDMMTLDGMLKKIIGRRFADCEQDNLNFEDHYLGGKAFIETFSTKVKTLRCSDHFHHFFKSKKAREQLETMAKSLSSVINGEAKMLDDHMGYIEASNLEVLSTRIDVLKDIAWCITSEIIDNIEKVKRLLMHHRNTPSVYTVAVMKQINAVLNSIDRLEVRGRDSAGISLLFVVAEDEYDKFSDVIKSQSLSDQLKERSTQSALVNLGISMNETAGSSNKKQISMMMTYKVAAEVGSLGDNVQFLREQIRDDKILQALITCSHIYHTVSAHTRWASVGAINEYNCHPVDNGTVENGVRKSGVIHVCLNGDIDNYLHLKEAYEKSGHVIHKDITTDTKIIPLQIEKYVNKGYGVEDAFRLAVNDFEGSHAISMHTDLAPGKFFLAQKGSGQAIFVGIAEDHYMPSSEVYGLVEETSRFIKVDGEKEIAGRNGKTQGQIFILDQDSAGGVEGIKAMFYDQTPVDLDQRSIKHTEITSRDIDRQKFNHYFFKEISESPQSVEKTIQNRWKFTGKKSQHRMLTVEEKAFPQALQQAFMEKRIQRIYLVGQGTAGVAALACENILNYYLDDPTLYIHAMKASEFSGFKLSESDDASSMANALVIAISQSGTTTDTNRAVDMVRERGAYTLAIVNRRDSDITFKVNGVMYTSSGRDIEMSVASTKAFYSQIVAGAIIGLNIARLTNRRDDNFVSTELTQLLELPRLMRKVLSMRRDIETSARRVAVTKPYWAAVGSGPNKASADEIRIKLSELCYKTISSDYVEDKKHIDLSSEPLIVVCAAGTRSTVIGDIIKDTAIFQAHKATPIVIADEGEDRFDPYAEDVFQVPKVSEHLAPILNTLVGHIWGYYAALSINEGSRFLYRFREDVQNKIDDHAGRGLDVYELVLEKSFKEMVAFFYKEFRKKKAENSFPAAMGLDAAADLVLLLKYLSGRLPVSDFEIDFGIKGTALNMLSSLFRCLGDSINCLSRPVDAIKHQAKTVTVGTSRISDKVEGILFDTLVSYGVNISQLINKNVMVLKNLQPIVAAIKGAIFYRIGQLNLLGEPTDETTIEIIKKDGVLKPIPSRVETDSRIKGTKKIIVREGNVYIGRGRKDDRSIIVIPIISASPATPNIIEYILLLNISFNENVPLNVKIKALGGKYERIKNIVQESSIPWDDSYIELIEMKQLFGISAEKIGESIVSQVKS